MMHIRERNVRRHHDIGKIESDRKVDKHNVQHDTGAATVIATTLFIDAGSTLAAIATMLLPLLFIMMTGHFSRMFMALISNKLRIITIMFLTGVHHLHWR